MGAQNETSTGSGEAAVTSVEQPTGFEDGAGGPAEYVSDAVVDLLRELGCRYLPLNPGSSFRGLHDSVVNRARNREPQLILCVHEEVAVSFAHGYAKATGSVGFAALHDLVGLMHGSMAVYNAWADEVPLMLLGGGGPLDPAARRPIDWVHSASQQSALIDDFVKWTHEPPTGPATLDAMARGHRIAASQPTGPVYVALDAAVQEERLDEDVKIPGELSYRPAPALHAAPEDVARAARLLLTSDKAVVVAGKVGLRPEATALLVELVEATGATALDERNFAAFPSAHPQNLSGSRALEDAEVVLAVELSDAGRLRGSWLGRHAPTAAELPQQAIIELSTAPLQPSSWSNRGGSALPPEVALVTDGVTGLCQVIDAVRELRAAEPDLVAEADLGRRREKLGTRHEQLQISLRAAAGERWAETPISPPRLVAEVYEAVKDEPYLLTHRNNRSWPHGLWQFEGAGQFLGGDGGGGIGYGPGAMVGAAAAARDQGRFAVGIIGDGDLLAASSALWTAVHYEIPMLMIVNNNGTLYNDEVHQRQMAIERGRPVENCWIGMRMADPAIDIASLSRSYGCWAPDPTTDPDALAKTFTEAVERVRHGAVAVVEVRTAAV